MNKSECDVCGKPATSFAQDVERREDLKTGRVTLHPVGDVKKGCDNHPVRSEETVVRSMPLPLIGEEETDA